MTFPLGVDAFVPFRHGDRVTVTRPTVSLLGTPVPAGTTGTVVGNRPRYGYVHVGRDDAHPANLIHFESLEIVS